jgi:predicted phosphoribosyltransferase
MDILENRREAGISLAKQLEKFRKENPIVLGMPRGGVVLAYEIAKILEAPLDVIISRKIGAPWNPEFAIGAIAPNGILILDQHLVSQYGIDEQTLQGCIDDEKHEMERRLRLYRGNKPFPDLKNRTVIIVDDGLATGRSAIAAVRSVKTYKPKKIVLAVGVCALDSKKLLQQEVDEVICLLAPLDLFAIGQYYHDFSQTTDEAVISLLQGANFV